MQQTRNYGVPVTDRISVELQSTSVVTVRISGKQKNRNDGVPDTDRISEQHQSTSAVTDTISGSVDQFKVRRGKVLLLFSGPHQRPDSLRAFLAQAGIEATEFDIVNEHMGDQNLLDDATWGRIRRDLQAGVYVALFAAPPCRTFSEVRTQRPGPPPLRERDYPYGYPRAQAKQRGISDEHLVMLREDNLLADRTAEACSILHRQRKVYGVEQPYPWKSGFSMFDLEAFAALEKQGAKRVVFDQCPFGAEVRKPTQILYWGADFGRLYARCDHPVITQINEDGTAYQSTHPNLAGEYLTKKLAAYPKQLNKAIASILADACRKGDVAS